MSQPDIQIKHSWYSLYTNFTHAIVKPYSASFVDKLLPDVEFNIFCELLNHNSCKVILSKKPCRPANATVRMVIKYHDEKDDIYENPWVDDCKFECNFSIPDGRYKIRKHDSFRTISYTFICCITWSGFKESMSSINDELYSHSKDYLTAPVFCDTIIVIDKTEIPVHKTLLEIYSDVFFNMFKADMTESANKRIVVTDVEVDVMEKVVEFLYTKTINPVPGYDVLLSILKVADKYKFKELKVLCEEKLSEKITIENVFEISEKNNLYGGQLLRKSVTYFMVRNKISVIGLKGLEDFLQ
ncbi:hypothetical protein PV327_008145 [Microctonus hyperodae]|uniref:BTB domain-containing protein n=1 Tax=Microctonus hyperodae TaxID=165561 RepID=A0AA39KGW1_MICHY|nr:hypothetical protein PV327_008145 [Microctonus hyperodae]